MSLDQNKQQLFVCERAKATSMLFVILVNEWNNRKIERQES